MADERETMASNADVVALDESEDERDAHRRIVRFAVTQWREGSFLTLAVFLVLGIAFGVAAKTLSRDRLTVGYWDYTVSSLDREAVDLNSLEKRVLARQEEQEKQAEEQARAENSEVPSDLPPLPPVPETPTLPDMGGGQ